MKIAFLSIGLIATSPALAYIDTRSTLFALATIFSPVPAAAYVVPSISHRIIYNEQLKRQNNGTDTTGAIHHHNGTATGCTSNSTVAFIQLRQLNGTATASNTTACNGGYYLNNSTTNGTTSDSSANNTSTSNNTRNGIESIDLTVILRKRLAAFNARNEHAR